MATPIALFIPSTTVRARVRLRTTRIPRRNSRRFSWPKSDSSARSAENDLITLMPERICTSRAVMSAWLSWRRRAPRRMLRPKAAMTRASTGATTARSRVSCQEM